MRPILVFVEVRDGVIKRVSFEVLSEARQLLLRGLPASGVYAVLIGDQLTDAAHEIVKKGWADRLYLVENTSYRYYSSERYASVVAEMIKRMDASLILMGATAMGRDLGPKVAAKLRVPVAQDCTALDVDLKHGVVATRPVYGGKAITKVHAQEGIRHFVVTVRPNVFSAGAPPINEEGAIEPFTSTLPDPVIKSVVTEVIAAASAKVDLTEAQIIVSGGRGLRESSNFSLLEELASTLNAAVGASRAAVDAGWKPHSYQVGLTGKTVSPLLYIACGISGAIQHQAGMSSSRYIVAINKDPNAPIFKIASVGIVGDLFEIIPRLTALLRKRAASH